MAVQVSVVILVDGSPYSAISLEGGRRWVEEAAKDGGAAGPFLVQRPVPQTSSTLSPGLSTPLASTLTEPIALL
jgi:hypothetical protein